MVSSLGASRVVLPISETASSRSDAKSESCESKATDDAESSVMGGVSRKLMACKFGRVTCGRSRYVRRDWSGNVLPRKIGRQDLELNTPRSIQQETDYMRQRRANVRRNARCSVPSHR